MRIDPIINKPQAMGLSFSVPKGAKIPPSLKNIYKELFTDIGMPVPDHGDISSWSQQGVFMLNASLTVEEVKPGSHLKEGWQQFTEAAIKYLFEKNSGLVFLSWGNFSHKCCENKDISP